MEAVLSGRFRAKRACLKRFSRLERESKGHILASTVLHMPNSLDSGWQEAARSCAPEGKHQKPVNENVSLVVKMDLMVKFLSVQLQVQTQNLHVQIAWGTAHTFSTVT